MAEKPTTAAGYDREYAGLVRATCLYVATKLGDLIEDLVVVGGLVRTGHGASNLSRPRHHPLAAAGADQGADREVRHGRQTF